MNQTRHRPLGTMTSTRSSNDPDLVLSAALYLLAGEILAYIVLGPLMTGVIVLRTSASGLAQVMGGDLAALIVVVPACLIAGVMVSMSTRGGALVAIAPAGFAVYTYSQIFLGSEFLARPGNVEMFFPLFAAIVITAAVVVGRSWPRLPAVDAAVFSPRQLAVTGWVFIAAAAFVVVGIHAQGYIDAPRASPTGVPYLETPTAFWVVKFWDLVVIAPASAAIGVALVRGRQSAVKPALAFLGGFTLLGCSVTGMAVRMFAVGDPDSSLAMVLVSLAVTALLAAATVKAYRPFVGPHPRPVPAAKERG